MLMFGQAESIIIVSKHLFGIAAAEGDKESLKRDYFCQQIETHLPF